MLKFLLCLALCSVVGTAMATTPALFHAGSGPPNVVPSGRDVCWSEPADLNGLIGSSEQIVSIGLETVCANDFVPTGTAVTGVTFWGGYWNNSVPCASGITTPGFNLTFYDDAGCMPGSNIASITATIFTETSVGCQAGTYPMFKWDIPDLSVGVTAGNLYWFGAQIADHPFPPQGGRLAAAVVTSCDTVFKSAYFGFPDWTPAVDVFGVAFDSSQEFLCNGIGPTGACCHPDGSCSVELPPLCDGGGDHYMGDGTTCDPNPCSPHVVGACCFSDWCRVSWPEDCAADGGQYQGDGTSCDPNPCQSTPTKSTTWGRIKGSYR